MAAISTADPVRDRYVSLLKLQHFDADIFSLCRNERGSGTNKQQTLLYTLYTLLRRPSPSQLHMLRYLNKYCILYCIISTAYC